MWQKLFTNQFQVTTYFKGMNYITINELIPYRYYTQNTSYTNIHKDVMLHMSIYIF